MTLGASDLQSDSDLDSIRNSCNVLYLREGVMKRKDILRSGWPPLPSYGQLIGIFFGVPLTLYYDYMCSHMDFTQEEGNY